MTKIQIVDDDLALLKSLRDNFQREGYEVLSAKDGALALEMIHRECPDLVILELTVPSLDGLAICRLIRKDPKFANIAVIMLTARNTQLDKMVALDSGADDYIIKPFELGELMARVRAVLRRVQSRPAPSRVLKAMDVRLDLVARKAFRGKEQLQLSVKEFDLLAELVRNQGAALSRDLILSRVWGRDFGDARTIDVHIRWLREKIEDDPSQPHHIVSVRGIGYRFES